MPKPVYQRVILKISGEALRQGVDNIIDNRVLEVLTESVSSLTDLEVQLGIVVGGGNIIRGARQKEGLSVDRAVGDYMGMLATMINCLAIQNAIEKNGIETRVMSAIEAPRIAELYIRRRAMRHFEKKRVLIFAAGTGNPFFTTDTAAALRAAELKADLVIKATNVDGVYSEDPKKKADAQLYRRLRYKEIFDKNIGIMDLSAVSLCMENNIPIIVLNAFAKNGLKMAVLGEEIGTLISSD